MSAPISRKPPPPRPTRGDHTSTALPASPLQEKLEAKNHINIHSNNAHDADNDSPPLSQPIIVQAALPTRSKGETPATYAAGTSPPSTNGSRISTAGHQNPSPTPASRNPVAGLFFAFGGDKKKEDKKEDKKDDLEVSLPSNPPDKATKPYFPGRESIAGGPPRAVPLPALSSPVVLKPSMSTSMVLPDGKSHKKALPPAPNVPPKPKAGLSTSGGSHIGGPMPGPESPGRSSSTRESSAGFESPIADGRSSTTPNRSPGPPATTDSLPDSTERTKVPFLRNNTAFLPNFKRPSGSEFSVARAKGPQPMTLATTVVSPPQANNKRSQSPPRRRSDSLDRDSDIVSVHTDKSENSDATEEPKEEPKPEDEHTRRTHIAGEIISTEKSYINSVDVMIKVYQPALQKLTFDPVTGLTRDHVKKIFCNVDKILMINKELLKDLEARFKDWHPTQLIGDVFLNMAPYLKMYTEYSNNYEDSQKMYTELYERNDPFFECLESCKQHPDNHQHIGLEHLLIMPIQRIPRYNLLLEDLLKHTAADHPDHANLAQALKKTKEVADHINKSVQQTENLKKLMAASSKGAGFRGLLEAHRRLINDGVLPVSFGMAKKPSDKVHFFLFNDILVYAKPSEVKKQLDMSKLDSKYPLNLVWIKDHPEHLFEIVAPGQKFVVHSNTVEEKVKWATAIRRAVTTVIADSQMTDDVRYGQFEVYDGGVYEGWWLQGKPHGSGSLKFFGNEYDGEFVEGRKCGMGKMVFVTGDNYAGQYENDLPNGFGTLYYAGGDSYIGMWKEGKRWGRGEFKFANEGSYNGEWINDVAHGQGTMIWRNGVKYEGGWSEGKFHGQGSLTSPTGKSYVGEWIMARKEGKGVMTYSNGSVYDGNWKDDVYHGTGSLLDKIEQSHYAGYFVTGLKDGLGNIAYSDGSKYEGSWKTGQKSGKGSYTYANGDNYSGGFKRDRYQGKGVYTKANGVKIEATWEKGEKEGKVTITLANGKGVLSGNAKDEVLQCNQKGVPVDFQLTPSPPTFDLDF